MKFELMINSKEESSITIFTYQFYFLILFGLDKLLAATVQIQVDWCIHQVDALEAACEEQAAESDYCEVVTPCVDMTMTLCDIAD